MNTYRVKVYVGESILEQISEIAKECGLIPLEGMQHLYFDIIAIDELDAKMTACKGCWGSTIKATTSPFVSVISSSLFYRFVA